MSKTRKIEVSCDPETGLCRIPELSSNSNSIMDWKTDEEIIYIGDPMCSWCWGISPQLNALQRYGQQVGIPFTLVMGGLRPGGGDQWNSELKDTLKHHWEEVNKRSGQPFGFDLFKLENFNYDTEPACRAVVTIRTIEPQKALSFLELVQHSFYVESNDPKEVAFYEPICKKLAINFTEFSQKFSSNEIKDATQKDFAQNRQWGVSGFPSVVYRKKDQLYFIARGYSTYETMKEALETIAKDN
jgi:putative protein-disulfide isomerase